MKDNIVRYSKVSNGMNYLDKRKYIKSNNTILLDRQYYFKAFLNDVNYTDLETLILDKEKMKPFVVIYETSAKNIFFLNEQNLGGLTIPFDFIIKNDPNIKLIWSDEYSSNINKINIVFNDKVKTIETYLIKEISILSDNDNVVITIINNNSSLRYSIDKNGNITNEKLSYTLTNEDIKNDTIDLRKYLEYKELVISNLEVDKLIINKYILKNYNRYYNINKIRFNTLNIIDDTDMKLIHKNIEIEENEKSKIIAARDEKGNYYLYVKGDNKKIVYIDEFDNLKVIEQKNLESVETIEKVKFIYENDWPSNFLSCLILIKYKNNKYEVREFDKTYELTKLFNKFLLLNFYYNESNIKLYNKLKNNDWFGLIDTYYLSPKSFKREYNDYLSFKKRIEKLLELGFSYKALIYFYERKLTQIINTEEENLINVDDMSKEEINLYNKIGEEYIKTKRLKK